MKRILFTLILGLLIAVSAHSSIQKQNVINNQREVARVEAERKAEEARVAEEKKQAELALIKKAETEPAKTITWQDNPNKCDMATQWIAASDFGCINKPKSAPVQSGQYASIGGVERWRALVAGYFGSETDYALRIMSCESGGNPNASSPTNDHGLMQINWPSHYNKVSALNDLYDPATNIRVAKQIRDGSGWSAWTCSRRV